MGQRIADSDTGVDAQSEIAEGGVLLYAPAESLLAGDAGVVRRPGDPSDVTGDSLQSRRAFAMRHHIALWDVIASCDITGASDASIRNATPNDLTPLLRDAPIARIFTTGAKSAQLYRRLIEPRLAATGITIGMTPLPSTSPANASMRLPALIDAYRLAFQSAGALEMADETVTGL